MIYHYTTFSTALNQILWSKRLKFSTIGNSNDPYEVKILPPMISANFGDHAPPHFYEEIRNYIFNRIQIACFVNDPSGWSNLPLWAHYGENGNGICLGFDEDSIKAHLATKNGISNSKSDVVEYPQDLSEYFNPPNVVRYIPSDTIETIREKVWESACKHFFRKDYAWRYENEYRIMVGSEKNEPYSIDIADSIREIVFGHQISSIVYNNKQIITNYSKIEMFYLHYDPTYNKLRKEKVL
jgi:hypothetical protein